ncbi:hypothetical protein HMPREF0653_00893 [Prevotella disiens JCM 6334 = ATCC 29426]|uniref:Uncharacterized protein n=1 Tax=Prevotella disiens JCM 6334 = ATCC 29426 TaxID=1235811 RepID=A0ABN0NTR3_9BACT|nr:hypothetical protein HMPREF0653_00893 [Prevotella disiens JCM 6334 = ATCC 29426]
MNRFMIFTSIYLLCICYSYFPFFYLMQKYYICLCKYTDFP